MSLEPQLIELNCVVFGVNPNESFVVEIAHNENVSALKPMIKKMTHMNDIPDDAIQLYKINLSEWAWTPLGDFTNMLRSAMPKEPLEPVDTLCKIYPSGSPVEDENLHIVAVFPEYVVGGADLFRTDDIQEILEELDYKLDSASLSVRIIRNIQQSGADTDGYASQNPFVAAVSSVADDSKTGFLKFIRAGGKEVSILRHLSAIDSPWNPTVPGIRFWPVRGGHVISMPSAGSPLTNLANPSARLWSVVRQLFEAVEFLHQHGVAHLDLKPDNVLIPPSGGRLSIIDFDTSVRVEGVDSMFRGVVGTRGFIPPEVEADLGEFSAVRADLWSCGRTVQYLCVSLCWSSMKYDILLGITQELTNQDPEKRPMMSEVLERMAEGEANGDLGMGLRWWALSVVPLRLFIDVLML